MPSKATLLFEVEILRVKFTKERTENVPRSTTTPPPTSDHSHKDDVNSSTSSENPKYVKFKNKDMVGGALLSDYLVKVDDNGCDKIVILISQVLINLQEL